LEGIDKNKKSSLPRGLGTKLLIAHYGGFNFDLKTERENLEKRCKRRRFEKSRARLLYVAENEMMLIDKEGQKIWKNSLKLPTIRRIQSII
jgi:hypothetical protein